MFDHIQRFVSFACCALAAGLLSAQTTWTRVATTGPTPRSSDMAFDSGRGRSVLFGGHPGAGGFLGDTWEWDGTVWSLRTTDGPIARENHAIVYDRSRRVIVLFGGAWVNFMRDTWTWDGRQWLRVTRGGPTPRVFHSMAYDDVRQKVVLFGGRDPNAFLDDTWEWDSQAWVQSNPTNHPSARQETRMVYDAQRRKVLLFGGWNGDFFGPALSDTWEWDGQNWTQRQPSTNAPGRFAHSMGYDESRARVVMFGGHPSFLSPPINDTWEWNGTDWGQRFPVNAPSPRSRSAATYDSHRERFVLFGGWDPGLGLVGDTWEYYTQSPASYAPFGQSCPGTQSTPTLAARAGDRPWVGDEFTVEVRGLSPNQPVVMLTGFSDTNWNGVRLPLLLDPIGMRGCALYTSPDDSTNLGNPLGVAVWSVRLPVAAGPLGLRFFNQAVVFDPGANALGLVASNGGAGTLGAR